MKKNYLNIEKDIKVIKPGNPVMGTVLEKLLNILKNSITEIENEISSRFMSIETKAEQSYSISKVVSREFEKIKDSNKEQKDIEKLLKHLRNKKKELDDLIKKIFNSQESSNDSFISIEERLDSMERKLQVNDIILDNMLDLNITSAIKTLVFAPPTLLVDTLKKVKEGRKEKLCMKDEEIKELVELVNLGSE